LLERYGYEGQAVKNAQSGRVALRVPGRTRMDKDTGATEECVKLITPTREKTMSRVEFDKSSWKAIDHGTFKQAWQEEITQLPEYHTREFYMVTGVILPLWDQMGSSSEARRNIKIRRLQTDDGQRYLGRVLSIKDVQFLAQQLGFDAPQEDLKTVWDRICRAEGTLTLAQNIRLSRRLVMGKNRIEITSPEGPAGCDRFVKFGAQTEIVNYTRRCFLPTNDAGWPLFEALTQAYPIQ